MPEDLRNKPEEYWKGKLTPEQFNVLREKGTERPYTGKYWDNHEDGMYVCGACGATLFDAKDKFESGTGWPSFTKACADDMVDEEDDSSYGMKRTEEVCHVCGSHLGHVFDDGPAPTGKRYCINSVSLDFEPKE